MAGSRFCKRLYINSWLITLVGHGTLLFLHNHRLFILMTVMADKNIKLPPAKPRKQGAVSLARRTRTQTPPVETAAGTPSSSDPVDEPHPLPTNSAGMSGRSRAQIADRSGLARSSSTNSLRTLAKPRDFETSSSAIPSRSSPANLPQGGGRGVPVPAFQLEGAGRPSPANSGRFSSPPRGTGIPSHATQYEGAGRSLGLSQHRAVGRSPPRQIGPVRSSPANLGTSSAATDIEFSPAVPQPVKFDVQERIRQLRGYLEPNRPGSQPLGQHSNIELAIKLYEEGTIDGTQTVYIVDGKVVDEEQIFKAPARAWVEVCPFFQRFQQQAEHQK